MTDPCLTSIDRAEVGRKRTTLRTVLFLGTILFGGLAGCSGDRSAPPDAAGPFASDDALGNAPAVPWPPDDRRNDRFVGSQACRECHQDLYDLYMAHPMANSTRRCDALTDPPFALSAEFTRSRRTYSVETVNGAMAHTESTLDASGEPIYRQSEPIEFAVGSGQRGFSFLSNRDGRLFQSPLTWYTKRGDWDLSPGYAPDLHPRFERRVSDGCVVCHAGRPIPEPGGYHSYTADVFAELAIGCERCHGPGEKHIAYHSGAESSGEDPIVNPQDLSSLARDSVCYQCHLHGLERILREGREELDFRPGDLISDVWAIFARGSGIKQTGATTAVSQVEQMVAGRCYLGSNGELGCTSCHDPHRIPGEEERVAFYRERCVRCHDDGPQVCGLEANERLRRVPNDSCIDCHMPRLAADDVPHTSQTDHRILRDPTKVSATVTTTRQGEIELFQPQDFPIPERESRRAYGLMFSKMALASGSSRFAAAADAALSPLSDRSSSDVPLLEGHAAVLLALGDPRTGEVARHGHQLAPGNESLLETLAILHEQRGEHAESLKYADRFLEINSRHSLMRQRQARLLAALGRDEDAIRSAQLAVKDNPTAISIRELLVTLTRRQGDMETAASHEQALQKLRTAPDSSGDAPTRPEDQ